MKWLGVGSERTMKAKEGFGAGNLAERGGWGVVKA